MFTKFKLPSAFIEELSATLVELARVDVYICHQGAALRTPLAYLANPNIGSSRLPGSKTNIQDERICVKGEVTGLTN